MKSLFKSFLNQKSIIKLTYQKTDQQFHVMIILAGQNSILQKLNQVGEILISTYPKAILLPINDSLNDHMLIIKALESGNADEVERLIRNHTSKARDILEGLLIKMN